jgi:hypothetical protein
VTLASQQELVGNSHCARSMAAQSALRREE